MEPEACAQDSHGGHLGSQRVGYLFAKRPCNKLVYLRDGAAQTIVRAAT